MDITDKASGLAHEAGDKIASATYKAAEALGEKGGQFMNAEQRLMEGCRAHINDYPVMSTVMAVGAGFLLNRVLNSD